jgi:hypothetical protein
MVGFKPQTSRATLSSAGDSTSPVRNRDEKIFVKVVNSFTGSLRLAFSTDEGVSYQDLTIDKDGNSLDITGPFSGPVLVGPVGVLWKVRAATLSGGTPEVTVIG